MSSAGGRGEGGAAIVFVVLMMMALLLVAHGVLVASLGELAASRAGVRALERRGASERALAETLVHPREGWMDSVGVWEVHTIELGATEQGALQGTWRRLGPESWLITGTVRDAAGPTTSSVRLAWSADPLTRVAGLRGVVTVAVGAPIELNGMIEAADPTGTRSPMREGDCEPWRSKLEARYSTEALPLLATLPDSSSTPNLGLLDLGTLIANASVSVAGEGTPGPAALFGACLVDEPWVWGDPDQPASPCGEHLPMRASAGDLVVSGGSGQGLLVVDGDLTLTAGARFYGLLLVRGMLRVQGAASLEGMALAGGGLVVGSESTLRASACWAVRAMSASRQAIGKMVPVASGSWSPR